MRGAGYPEAEQLTLTSTPWEKRWDLVWMLTFGASASKSRQAGESPSEQPPPDPCPSHGHQRPRPRGKDLKSLNLREWPPWGLGLTRHIPRAHWD